LSKGERFRKPNRATALAVLESTQTALAIPLTRQIMMDEMMLMEEEEVELNEGDAEALE
jgi:hypothetical protein